MVQKIITYCLDRNIFFICITGLLVNIIMAVSFFGLLNIVDNLFFDNKPFIMSVFNRKNLPISTTILAYIIIGPLFETFIAQYLPINIFQRYLNMSGANYILFSATVFGLLHYQSPFYMLYAFLHGLVYASMYLVFQYRNVNAYLYVFTTHAFFNLVVMIPNFFK